MRLREGRGERTDGRGGMSSNMPGDLICKYCRTQFKITFTKLPGREGILGDIWRQGGVRSSGGWRSAPGRKSTYSLDK